MGVSQIILLSIVGLNLMLTSYMHGKPKEGNHSIFVTLFGTLIHLTQINRLVFKFSHLLNSK